MITKSLGIFGLLFGMAAGLGSAYAANPCATPDSGSNPPSTCYFDLTASPSSTPNPTGVLLNGGLFQVPAQDGSLGKGTIVGTGVFQPFVRIQQHGANQTIEEGFNTGNTAAKGPNRVLDDHDNGGSNWNHAIKLSDLSTVTVNGHQYYEFLLDINEPGNYGSGLSLDAFKLYVAGQGDITSYNLTGDLSSGVPSFQLGGGASKVYDMDQVPGGDASILMDYNNFSGSGNGVDLQALVPVENFDGAAQDSFVYLYSKFGVVDSNCKPNGNYKPSPCLGPDGTPISAHAGSLNYGSAAGFEEWSIRAKQIPLPSTALLLGVGMLALALGRTKREFGFR